VGSKHVAVPVAELETLFPHETVYVKQLLAYETQCDVARQGDLVAITESVFTARYELNRYL
jgi:hypothetical protein